MIWGSSLVVELLSTDSTSLVTVILESEVSLVSVSVDSWLLITTGDSSLTSSSGFLKSITPLGVPFKTVVSIGFGISWRTSATLRFAFLIVRG